MAGEELIGSLEVIGVRNALGQFASWETALDQASVQKVTDVLETIRTAMAAEAPRSNRVGLHFADAIQTRVYVSGPGSIAGEIFVAGDKANLTPWIIFGVAPHAIDARNVPKLRFFWEREGINFVGPHVNHPGSRPNDFAARGMASVEARTLTDLRSVVNQVLIGVTQFEGAGPPSESDIF